MAKVRRCARSFEDLHIHQRARELTNAIYRHTRCGAFAKDYGLSQQIRRAAVSIMSNVAEGLERRQAAQLANIRAQADFYTQQAKTPIPSPSSSPSPSCSS